MRIISGKYRGKKINPPNNLPVRPTTDYAKEALFNCLANKIDFEDIKVLDLFCGTGNITFEFASRGVEDLTCVEINFKCAEFIKRTVLELKAKGIKVITSDVYKFISYSSDKYDLIFADPPYDMQETLFLADRIFEKQLLNKNGYLVIEHPEDKDFSNNHFFEERRKYGKVNFSFFHNK
ncbi:MAG: 16S rRNA (guanine(966)-N(2))-methyltransferase RsmD [Bacteroidetes bacterium]|nr:16S rRNA (guanine(966)-N(2))-methyltransferase RsmD [Bacteroidota bacterium]HET6245020.1 16S rRNA (guanine(966)-N(2))-methyltransferase RsmD [Bacteroidia bacterium]